MKSYYCLTKEIDKEWTPKIKDFIKGNDKILNLTEVGVMNPSRLRDILTDIIGYKEDDTRTDFNGWEWDFWFYFNHPDLPSLTMRGTGMTFELYLERN